MMALPDKLANRAYASADELAEMLGISRETWYRHYYPHVRSGRVQSLKIGSARRIRLSSFLDMIEKEEAHHGT